MMPAQGIRTQDGQLNRSVQRRLGDTLRAMYEEIVNEGVPPRFVELLKQIDARRAHGKKPSDPSKNEDPAEVSATSTASTMTKPDQLDKKKGEGDKQADNGAI